MYFGGILHLSKLLICFRNLSFVPISDFAVNKGFAMTLHPGGQKTLTAYPFFLADELEAQTMQTDLCHYKPTHVSSAGVSVLGPRTAAQCEIMSATPPATSQPLAAVAENTQCPTRTPRPKCQPLAAVPENTQAPSAVELEACKPPSPRGELAAPPRSTGHAAIFEATLALLSDARGKGHWERR